MCVHVSSIRSYFVIRRICFITSFWHCIYDPIYFICLILSSPEFSFLFFFLNKISSPLRVYMNSFVAVVVVVTRNTKSDYIDFTFSNMSYVLSANRRRADERNGNLSHTLCTIDNNVRPRYFAGFSSVWIKYSPRKFFSLPLSLSHSVSLSFFSFFNFVFDDEKFRFFIISPTRRCHRYRWRGGNEWGRIEFGRLQKTGISKGETLSNALRLLIDYFAFRFHLTSGAALRKRNRNMNHLFGRMKFQTFNLVHNTITWLIEFRVQPDQIHKKTRTKKVVIVPSKTREEKIKLNRS